MAKGRRERDRPKATPGASYNPNKRVKLSYDDSESEGEADGGADAHLPAFIGPAKPTNLDTTGEGAANDHVEDAYEPIAALADGAEALEEQAEESVEDEVQDEPQQGAAKSMPRLKNVRTGQFHALGVLSWREEGDQEEGEEGEEGSVESAMEYLRSVRTERQTLPDVLSGPDEGYPEDYHNFEGDHAYIAAPASTAEYIDQTLDPREAFTEALKKRFRSQSHLLRLPQSAEAVAALNDKQPISYPKSNNKAMAEWLKIFTSVPPASAQVRSLNQEIVYRLLELLQDRCLLRQKNINRITSAWIWSLLARLSEVGMMNNDEVYAVRAFGKKAVLVLVSFRSSEAAAQLEDIANAEAGASATDSKQVASDSAEIDSEAHRGANVEAADRENTLATLDSILVIVGDIFGQRDLLEFRQPWEATEGGIAPG